MTAISVAFEDISNLWLLHDPKRCVGLLGLFRFSVILFCAPIKVLDVSMLFMSMSDQKSGCKLSPYLLKPSAALPGCFQEKPIPLTETHASYGGAVCRIL